MSAEILRRAANDLRIDGAAASDDLGDFLYAVADWLGGVIADHDAGCFTFDGHPFGWTPEHRSAVTVARAYLGESS